MPKSKKHSAVAKAMAIAEAAGAKYRSLGFVYVAKLDDGVYKIGMTSRISYRMYQLMCHYQAKRVVVIHKFRAVKCRSAEKQLHGRYSRRRIHPRLGRYTWVNPQELFALTNRDIAQIKKIIFFDGSKFITGGDK